MGPSKFPQEVLDEWYTDQNRPDSSGQQEASNNGSCQRERESEMKESKWIQTRKPADIVCAVGWNNNIWYQRHTCCTLTIVPLRSCCHTRKNTAITIWEAGCYSNPIKSNKLGWFCSFFIKHLQTVPFGIVKHILKTTCERSQSFKSLFIIRDSSTSRESQM